MEYTVDLTTVAAPEQFHQAIRQSLPVPEWYGNDLDALYDVLTQFGQGWQVRFLHPERLREHTPRYLAALERLCQDVQAEMPGTSIVFLP